MARYKMEDGTVVDTALAVESWDQATDWDGSNNIGRSSRSQWIDHRLYKSKKGRYYLVVSPRIDRQLPHAEWYTPQEAARWLLHNDEELPEDLAKLAEEVSE